MTITAYGAEVDTTGEIGSLAAATAAPGGWRVRLAFYGPATDLPAACEQLSDPDALGCYIDPMPCAAILDNLAAAIWLHRLEAVDVAAAAGQFLQLARARSVTAEPHPALEAALVYAVRRPLAAAFGFERRKVPEDMSPLNACAHALWGLRRNAAAQDPGVWVV